MSMKSIVFRRLVFSLALGLTAILPAVRSVQGQWAATYGNDEDRHLARSIQPIDDGGYIVAGYKEWNDSNGFDIWVLKLDGDGYIDWQKTYGGYGWDVAASIQQTSDGDYIVAGETSSFGSGEKDFCVLRLDEFGDIEWQKVYGGSTMDHAESIQPTVDGGYIVAGETESFGAGSSDAWLVKLNSEGNIEWQKAYGNDFSESVQSIQQTADGGYIAAGAAAFGISYQHDFWVLKLNGAGDIEWQKTYGRYLSDGATSIQATSDGGYIVAGLTDQSSFDYDFWVLKLNGMGYIEWQKIYGGFGWEELESIRQTDDDGFIVTGYADSFGPFYVWVLKLNGLGRVEWQKAYGGKEFSWPYSIEQTSDQGYIVAGCRNCNSFQQELVILKLRPDGTINPSCRIISDTDVEDVSSTLEGSTSCQVITTETSVTPQDISVEVRDTDVSPRFFCSDGEP